MMSLALIACAALAAAPGDAPRPRAPAADWPMFLGDPAHTGVASAPARPALPAREAWSFPAGEDPIESSAAIRSGSAFIGTGGGEVIRIDLASGKAVWRRKFEDSGGFKATPLVAAGKVFIGDGTGTFHALSAEDGKDAWTFKAESEIVSSANIWSGPEGERVLFGSYDANLYCLAAADGKLAWKLTTDAQVHATLAIDGGVALTAGCDGQLRVVDIATGKETAKVPMGGGAAASPAVSGGVAYLGTLGGQVIAADWKKGSIAWTFEDPDRQFEYRASPALPDGLVIVAGRDKRVRAFVRSTGKEAWTFAARSRLDSSPAVCGGLVFAGGADGDLVALDAKTGEKRWSFSTGASISTSPSIGEGRLVVGTDDGKVWCLDLREAAGDRR